MEMTEHPTRVAKQERRSRMSSATPLVALRKANEKSEDYSKADFKQRVLFFITIFRLAIPAFFRFTDVTELM